MPFSFDEKFFLLSKVKTSYGLGIRYNSKCSSCNFAIMTTYLWTDTLSWWKSTFMCTNLECFSFSSTWNGPTITYNRLLIFTIFQVSNYVNFLRIWFKTHMLQKIRNWNDSGFYILIWNPIMKSVKVQNKNKQKKN